MYEWCGGYSLRFEGTFNDVCGVIVADTPGVDKDTINGVEVSLTLVE